MVFFVERFVLISILVLSIDALSPSLRQTNIDTCEDDQEHIFVINSFTGREVPCSWIDLNVNDIDNRRSAQCDIDKKPENRAACPRACGICCGDNPDFTWMYDHPEKGEFEVNCDSVRIYKMELCPIVGNSCPGACGLCPTLAPTKSPTRSPTVNPVQHTPSPIPPTSTSLILTFAAEVYTKDATIKSLSTIDILNGINEFFRREREGYENHKIFTSMANDGIEFILFSYLSVNDSFKGYQMKCRETPEAYKNSVCSTFVATAKFAFNNDSSRRVRRLNSDQLNKVNELLLKHSGAVSDIIDNVDGIALVNTVVGSDFDSLAETTPSIAKLSEKNNKAARIALPVVLSVIIVGLVLIACFILHRRKNAIVVELKETVDDEDDHHLLSKITRKKQNNSQEVEFPVSATNGDNKDLLISAMDKLCGAESNDTSTLTK